ncbi:hypothetical protein LINGRAHAP2_LOCUS12814 [Linum grandiflorum]
MLRRLRFPEYITVFINMNERFLVRIGEVTRETTTAEMIKGWVERNFGVPAQNQRLTYQTPIDSNFSWEEGAQTMELAGADTLYSMGFRRQRVYGFVLSINDHPDEQLSLIIRVPIRRVENANRPLRESHTMHTTLDGSPLTGSTTIMNLHQSVQSLVSQIYNREDPFTLNHVRDLTTTLEGNATGLLDVELADFDATLRDYMIVRSDTRVSVIYH